MNRTEMIDALADQMPSIIGFPKVDARYDFNQPTPVNVAGYYQKNILDGKRHSPERRHGACSHTDQARPV